MNAYDAAIVLSGLALVLFGAIKGVLRVLIGIGSLVFAFLLGAWFDGVAGSLFSGLLASDGARRLAGFALIFIGVLVLGGIAGWLVVKVLEAAKLRWIDRFAGAVAGAIATIMLFGALSVPLATYLPEGSRLLRDSRLAPSVVKLARAIDGAIPASVRQRFRQRADQLERSWREARR